MPNRDATERQALATAEGVTAFLPLLLFPALMGPVTDAYGTRVPFLIAIGIGFALSAIRHGKWPTKVVGLAGLVTWVWLLCIVLGKVSNYEGSFTAY